MAGIVVRVARPDDVTQMSELGRRVFTETYGATAMATDISRHVADYFSEPAMQREIARASVQYLLAIDGDACAGLVKLRDNAPPRFLAHTRPLEIQQLYVASAFQRKGIGRRLMDAAVDAAKDRGSDGMWLSVWTEADWATRFYLGYGFRALGEIPFMLGETEYIDYLMWLPLEVQYPG